MRFDMTLPIFTLTISKYQGVGGGCTVAYRGITGRWWPRNWGGVGYLHGLLSCGLFGFDTLHGAGGHIEIFRYGSDRLTSGKR